MKCIPKRPDLKKAEAKIKSQLDFTAQAVLDSSFLTEEQGRRELDDLDWEIIRGFQAMLDSKDFS